MGVDLTMVSQVYSLRFAGKQPGRKNWIDTKDQLFIILHGEGGWSHSHLDEDMDEFSSCTTQSCHKACTM